MERHGARSLMARSSTERLEQPAHSLAFEASVILSGRIVPGNSRSSYPQPAFELGRVVLLMTPRPLESHSSLN